MRGGGPFNGDGLTRVHGVPRAGEALSDGDTLRRIWALPVPRG